MTDFKIKRFNEEKSSQDKKKKEECNLTKGFNRQVLNDLTVRIENRLY